MSPRILVLGAGAIGGYVGGSLGAAGHHLVLLCTPGTAAEIRAGGLHVQTEAGTLSLAPEVVERPEEVFAAGDVDLLIVAVKRYDTAAAAAPLAGFGGRIDRVLCLQNGIGAEEELAGLLAHDRILPGTVTTAVRRLGRSTVLVEKKRGVAVGGTDPAAPRWAQALDRAGLAARHYPNAQSMKWSKLLTNLVANATSAILDMPPSDIFRDPDLFRLEMLQLREALAVMRALGLQVVNLPGTPVRLLAFGARSLPTALARPLMARTLGRGRGGKMPSLHADLHGGLGISEIGYYHGAVVREADRLGIPAPTNRMLVEIYTDILEGRRPHAAYRRRPLILLADLPDERLP